MSWLRKLLDALNWSSKNTWLGTQLRSFANTYTRGELTGAESEQNAFNAAEAEKNRAFQEEMRNTSFQAQVRDMQAAGLNPALMYGGAGSNGASVPAGSAATGSAGSGHDIGTLISSIMDMALLKSQIKNIDADTTNKLAEAAGKSIENQFKPDLLALDLQKGEVDISNILQGIKESESRISVNASDVRLNDARVREVMSSASKMDIEAATERLKQANIEADTVRIAAEIENLYADKTLKILEQAVLTTQAEANRSVAASNYAQAKYVNLGSVEREFEKGFREEFGTNPNQPIWNAAVGMLGKASHEIGQLGGKVLDFIKGK